MSKVNFIDLPEGVQVIAADLLKQQMNCVRNGEWCAEATRIANAFLSMYEGKEPSINVEHHIIGTTQVSGPITESTEQIIRVCASLRPHGMVK